jgi:tetratricopeptide (TPR) repeat protein
MILFSVSFVYCSSNSESHESNVQTVDSNISANDLVAPEKIDSLQLALDNCRAGNHQGSIAILNQYLKSHAKNDTCINNIGVCHLHMNDPLRAKGYFVDALSLNDQYHQCFYNLGSAYVQMKQYSFAIKAFDRCIDIDSTYSMAWSNRAVTYYFLNDFEQAIKDYSQAIKLEPKNSSLYVDRAKLLARVDLKDYACNDIRKAAELGNQEAISSLKVLCP